MKKVFRISNSALKNIKTYREEWETTGYVSTKNFLDETSAHLLYTLLSKKIPEYWWFRSFKIDEEDNMIDEKINMKLVQKDKSVKALTDNLLLKCQEAFSRHVYCFSFDSAHAHKTGCPCLLCEYKQFINSGEFKEFVQAVTNTRPKLNDIHFKATRYQSGQFLAPHTDEHHGFTAAIHHMTQNWLPSYGGNLQILSNDSKKVKKTVVPEFNTLTFLDLKNARYCHGVTHVAPFVKRSRYALTYWLNKEESKNESG